LPSENHRATAGQLSCLSWHHLGFPELCASRLSIAHAGGDVLQMVHDLIAVSNPQYFRGKITTLFCRWLDEALQYATRFAGVSSYTAVICAGMPRNAIWRHPFTSRGWRMSSSALSATLKFPCRHN